MAPAVSSHSTKHSNEVEGWTFVEDGRGVKLYPELRESIWQTDRSPFDTYDKIAVHRVVKEGIKPKGVVFILPGTWSNAEQLISNPTDDWWSADEDHSFAYFLANRGFVVYAIDYRTHFVPPELSLAELEFMAEWGWDAWIGDIKEGVELAKEVSDVKKLFIAGDSFGGSAAMNYASLYWEEDLKGILLRDGGTGTKYLENVNNAYDLPAAIAGMNAFGLWGREVGGPGSHFVMKYADENPGAPAEYMGFPLTPTENPLTPEYDPWANITEWAAYQLYVAWGLGRVTNIYGGYGDPRVMIHIDATFDRYWPARLSLESAAISDWDNCPYVTYDFDDHYQDIDVPLLAFSSERFGLAFMGPFRHGIANPDFTGHYLWGYGHLDVYSGEYSKDDVSQPTYEWLMNHRMLEGYGKIKFENNKIKGKATIYINETTIDFKIDDERFSWTISNHYSHGSTEVFYGQSDIGSIKISIKNNRISIAKGQKIHFIGYKM